VNRVTILVVPRACFLSVQSWHDFRLAGQVFRIRLVVPWVVRTKRVTIWQNVTRFWQLQGTI